jgi:hypothetical protein
MVIMVYMYINVFRGATRSWHGAVATHFTCNEKIPSSNLGVS